MFDGMFSLAPDLFIVEWDIKAYIAAQKEKDKQVSYDKLTCMKKKFFNGFLIYQLNCYCGNKNCITKFLEQQVVSIMS